jgi:ATP-dependent 26S proteasome regulatory subunit
MMRMSHFPAGSVEHAEAPVGPGRTRACVDFAVLLVSSPGGPLAVFLHRGEADPFQRASEIELQVAAADRDRAEAFIADLRALIEEHDVFRGQVITIESSPQGTQLVFVERPEMAVAELVLPDGVIERVERHLVGPSVHRDKLLAMGRHLSRGLLLWGPPGTGKTHTVRYLTGRLTGATVIILAGGALGAVGAFGTVARRLAPSVVILEDVDLVAEDRYTPGDGSPVLFQLMDQMSGLSDDADVAFVLTTNRPDALEPALAARPGRVDLAVEIPLPDAAARTRLLELYGRGLDMRLDEPGVVVDRTEGVTASFMKELLRKSALVALEAGREQVTDPDIGGALDELLSETSALTRVLLGSGGEDAPRPGSGWLERFPEWEEGDGGSSFAVIEPSD